MDRPFIETLHIESYGCIQDLTLTLTPLHALIGPNDTGKSTVLRALRTLTETATGAGWDSLDHERQALLGLLFPSQTEDGCIIDARTSLGASYQLRALPGQRLEVREGENADEHAFLRGVPGARDAEIRRAVAGSQLLRLDADALRQPTPLIQEGQPIRLLDARGTGLPGIYDAILNRDLPSFMAINEQVAKLFPSVKALSLKNPTPRTKALGIQLVDGTYVSAEHMSEGLLYYLAFAALPYTEPNVVILIEEPENGLHPARIVEVMRVLREISKTTQVIVATHSPLVVNELEPDEVTVLTRSAKEGVKGTLMKDTANFEERSKVYALGELWVSYANGYDEGALMAGEPGE